VFKIGPRINASGRIQNGKEAVELLIEKDFSSALEKANLINQYNETRKDLDKTMTEEANHIVDSLEGLADRRTIVIYNEAWHKGVIGIVASRLTEIYYRPAVVLTRTDNLATGSARSVSGFDVYKAIENCRDLLENFGGHTYAAGLSMKVENVEEFRNICIRTYFTRTNQCGDRHRCRNRFPRHYPEISCRPEKVQSVRPG
jgi:single-stranded-DNA-specific exonuclease